MDTAKKTKDAIGGVTYLMSFALLVAGFIAAILFIDFGFLKGEITEYPLVCFNDEVNDYKCPSGWSHLNPTTYKPNVSKQTVQYWHGGLPGIKTLTQCSVLNLRNWTCNYDDKSAVFGFKDGQYYEVALKGVGIDDEDEIIYVPKYRWRLEWFGFGE